MKLSDLSRKQKRIQEWSSFLQEEKIDEDRRANFVEMLKSYKNLIAKCWESDLISEEDQKRILDWERRLEQCFDDARLVAR